MQVGDWYANKANEMQRLNLQERYDALGQAEKHFNRPQMMYDTESDELIQAPLEPVPYPARNNRVAPGASGASWVKEAAPQGKPPGPPRPGMKWQWVPD